MFGTLIVSKTTDTELERERDEVRTYGSEQGFSMQYQRAGVLKHFGQNIRFDDSCENGNGRGSPLQCKLVPLQCLPPTKHNG